MHLLIADPGNILTGSDISSANWPLVGVECFDVSDWTGDVGRDRVSAGSPNSPSHEENIRMMIKDIENI